MEEKRVYRPYVPKLKYDDEIDHPTRKRMAGYCYRSEELMLAKAEYVYKSKIVKRRRVKRTYHILYQVLFESGITVEIAFLEVGIKGYYVRYTKVKQMNFRASRTTGSRKRVETVMPEIDVKEFRKRKSEEEKYHHRQLVTAAKRRYRKKKRREKELRKQFGLEEKDNGN